MSSKLNFRFTFFVLAVLSNPLRGQIPHDGNQTSTAPAISTTGVDSKSGIDPKAAFSQQPIHLLNGADAAEWYLYLGEGKSAPEQIKHGPDGVVHVPGNLRGYYVTKKTYSNYRIHVEYRWPEGAPPRTNAGFFMHVQKPDAIWPVCVEAQMAQGNAGQIVGQGGADVPGAPLIDNKKRAPKLAEASDHPIGQWNSFDIICRENSLEVFVNGVKQNQINNLPIKAGAIGFQLEGFAFEFRNIRLNPLPD